jgi:hypothetical protein
MNPDKLKRQSVSELIQLYDMNLICFIELVEELERRIE